MSININRETLCGLSNSPFASPSFVNARTISPISDSLLSAKKITGGKLKGQNSIELSNEENAEEIANQLHKPIPQVF